jgi:hypothetical protein
MSKIPLFPNLSAIRASLLGALIYNTSTTWVGDFDNAPANEAIFYNTYVSGYSHAPSSGGVGVVLTIRPVLVSVLQLASEADHLYYRSYYSDSGWTTWKDL